jgi:hypothetical protein
MMSDQPHVPIWPIFDDVSSRKIDARRSRPQPASHPWRRTFKQHFERSTAIRDAYEKALRAKRP